MKRVTLAALLLAGCHSSTIQSPDGRRYVQVTRPENSIPGVPGTEAIYQVEGSTGSGKPAYIRSLGSPNTFTRVGDLP